MKVIGITLIAFIICISIRSVPCAIVLTPVNQRVPCDEQSTDVGCWKLQGNNTNKYEINQTCAITRMENSTHRQPDIENQTLILDPCMDEENRNFMECVLNYEPNVTSHDDKGICMCYRQWEQWPHQVTITPAYNQSLNYSEASENWFIYDEHLGECVVRLGKPCAPIGTLIVPYRCQKTKDSDGETIDAYCIKQDPNNARLMACTAGARETFERSTLSQHICLAILSLVLSAIMH